MTVIGLTFIGWSHYKAAQQPEITQGLAVKKSENILADPAIVTTEKSHPINN